MEYSLVFAGLAAGSLLIALGLFGAVIYTPFGYSLQDTVATAITGACLQVGNLIVVASVTAITFDLLTMAGVEFSLVLPASLGYAVFHLVLYRSSVSVTRLQGTPFDPETALSSESLRQITPDRLQALGARGRKGS